MKNPIFSATKGLTISFAEVSGPQNMARRHYHDNYEIFLMIDGERNLFFDNKKYLLEKGSLFVIEPFLSHGTASTENPSYKRYLLNLAPQELSPILSPNEINILFDGVSTCALSLNEEDFHTAMFYLSEIDRHKREHNAFSEKLARMFAVHLMELISRETNSQNAIKLESTTKKNEIPIMHALRYINLNFTENITLDFISEYAHMSKSNFCLVFKKMMGETFIDYLNTLRIAQVHKLLITTNMQLGAIAEQTGFSSVDYMTRMFKKVHGAPPSSVRRES
ncbi:MAG: helix-turn-helix transcriptional regulator [Oscillospiraceae bacterium]|nr:helix-turn-helix transcriptional regulator [Oscillospiraceae bacterium]